MNVLGTKDLSVIFQLYFALLGKKEVCSFYLCACMWVCGGVESKEQIKYIVSFLSRLFFTAYFTFLASDNQYCSLSLSAFTKSVFLK